MAAFERYITPCMQCGYPECPDCCTVSYKAHPIVHLLECRRCNVRFAAVPKQGRSEFAATRVRTQEDAISGALILSPHSADQREWATQRYLSGQQAAASDGRAIGFLDFPEGDSR